MCALSRTLVYAQFARSVHTLKRALWTCKRASYTRIDTCAFSRTLVCAICRRCVMAPSDRSWVGVTLKRCKCQSKEPYVSTKEPYMCAQKSPKRPICTHTSPIYSPMRPNTQICHMCAHESPIYTQMSPIHPEMPNV